VIPRPLNRWRPVAKMGSAFRKALAFSGETWTPTPEPERPRGADAGRSPEATARRRERKQRDRWSTPIAVRAVEPAPVEPTAPPDFTIQTPEACSWGDGRYMRWLLPTCNGRSGLDYKDLMEIQLTAKRRRESDDDHK
jgi:hypothetical protein